MVNQQTADSKTESAKKLEGWKDGRIKNGFEGINSAKTRGVKNR